MPAEVGMLLFSASRGLLHKHTQIQYVNMRVHNSIYIYMHHYVYTKIICIYICVENCIGVYVYMYEAIYV